MESMMEFASDNLIARALLTVATLGYSLVLAVVDFGRTHATNPLWTAHARFHVVWQVSSYCFIALIVLFLTWSAGPIARLWLAIILTASVYAGFYAAVLSKSLFGGELADSNGVPPIAKLKIGGGIWTLDANMASFSLASAMVIAAALLVVS
jgi:hypothetical protein